MGTPQRKNILERAGISGSRGWVKKLGMWTPPSERETEEQVLQVPEEVFPWGLWRGPHARASTAACGGPHAKGCWCTLKGRDPRCSSFTMINCSLQKGPTLEQGESMRRKEWQRGTFAGWLQAPFPIPLQHSRWGGRELRSEEVRWSLGKREVGGLVFNFDLVFAFHYPNVF